MAFLGIAGAAYVSTQEVTLDEGEATTVGDYEVVFLKLEHVSENDVMAARSLPKGALHETTAYLSYSSQRRSGTLEPSVVYYNAADRPHTEVDFSVGPKEDLYAILSGYDGQRISLKLLVNPMTVWLWIGGAFLVLGAIVAAWPVRSVPARPAIAPESEAEIQAKECLACGASIAPEANFCPSCGANQKELNS